jgi:hypothetical protein
MSNLSSPRQCPARHRLRGPGRFDRPRGRPAAGRHCHECPGGAARHRTLAGPGRERPCRMCWRRRAWPPRSCAACARWPARPTQRTRALQPGRRGRGRAGAIPGPAGAAGRRAASSARAPGRTGSGPARCNCTSCCATWSANALDALAPVRPDGRSLRIDARLDGSGMLVLTVRDSGAGMDAEQARQAFEPMYGTKPHGLGLGLAICRAIVDAHDGQHRRCIGAGKRLHGRASGCRSGVSAMEAATMDEPRDISVLVADDHPLIVAGLAAHDRRRSRPGAGRHGRRRQARPWTPTCACGPTCC